MLGAQQVDLQRELDRLRVELEELRASRRRLVLGLRMPIVARSSVTSTTAFTSI